MKKTKYILPLLAVPALALTLLGAGVASANGAWNNINPEDLAKRQQTMFEHQSTVLGIPINEVKDAWAQGKNIQDLAKEKGISETDLKAKMDAQRKQQHQDRLKSLVSSGVITQAQADQRLQFEEKNPNKGRHMMGGAGRGMGMHEMRQNLKK
jgi:predicted ATPase